MGLNTIHNKINDKGNGYNLTKNSKFGFEVMGASTCRKIEMAMNLAMFQVKLAIKINGTCDIELDDKVRVLGKVYKVISADSTLDNQDLLRIRDDIENFTGDLVVGLE